MAVALFVGAGAPGAKRLVGPDRRGCAANGCNMAFACSCYRSCRRPDPADSSMGNSDWMTTMSGLSSPNKWGLVFHHLGLAAKDPEAATHFLTGLGYRIGPMIFDPLQNVHRGNVRPRPDARCRDHLPGRRRRPARQIAVDPKGRPRLPHVLHLSRPGPLAGRARRRWPIVASIPFLRPRKPFCSAASGCHFIWSKALA